MEPSNRFNPAVNSAKDTPSAPATKDQPAAPGKNQSGRQITSTTDAKVTLPQPTSESEKPTHLTELGARSTEKVPPQPTGWWQAISNLPSQLMGKKIEQTTPMEGVIPPAERAGEAESGGFTKRFKSWVSSLVSSTGWVNRASGGTLSTLTDGALTYFTGTGFSGNVRQYLSEKKVNIPGMSDQDFQVILGSLATLLSSESLDNNCQFQEIEIPVLEIDIGLVTPLRIKGLKFRTRLALPEHDCALIQRQAFQRTIEIKDLECTIDLPRPDQPPATLNITLPEGVLTGGSDLAEITTITDIGQLLIGGNNSSLPFDHTAIQLKTNALRIEFDKLNSATPFDLDAPISLDDPGILGFNKGIAELTDVTIATPLSLLRQAPDQTTFVQCGGFKLTNKKSRELLVDIKCLDASSLDPQLSGSVKLDADLDLRKLRHFPGLSLLPKWLCNAQLNCSADIVMHKGEIDFKQAKKGIKLSPADSNWLSRSLAGLINQALSSERTKLVQGEQGETLIHVHLPLLETLRKIPVLGKLIPNEFPLPITGLQPIPDSEGKLVAVEIISETVQELKMGWFGMPGKTQLVRKDHEQLCTAAASGVLSVSKALITQAEDLELSGHHSEARRMLQAIPYAHYASLSYEDTRVSVKMLNRMAHKLVDVDPDKAIALYGLTLKGGPIGELPKGYDGESVMQAALRLDTTKPNELAVALDVFEFLAISKPDSNAFAKLTHLCKTGLYPLDRLSPLMTKVIHLPPYADNLSHQAGLLHEMEPLMGVSIKGALESLPTHKIEDLHGITAKETAANFEVLMQKYNLSVQAARMYQGIGDTQQAKRILERAIHQNTPDSTAALHERLSCEIFQALYGTPRYISAYQLLTKLPDSSLSPDMIQNRNHLLKILWRETRSMPLQWPDMEYSPAASDAEKKYKQALSGLFAIEESLLNSPDQLHQSLIGIKKTMNEAKALMDASDQNFAGLNLFAGLTESLLGDASIEIELIKHMGKNQGINPIPGLTIIDDDQPGGYFEWCTSLSSATNPSGV